MRKMMLAAALALLTALPTSAAEAPKAPDRNWSFDGLFGTYDRVALRQGLQVYTQVCAACHSLSLLAFRHLAQVGYTEDEIKAIAEGVEVTDGPDEEGEMYTRPGRPADYIPAPYPNEQAARAANGGALPPDLSVITKARKGGADYLFAVLTGYKDAPVKFNLMEGMHYNAYFPGHQIAMPPPLTDGAVEYPDGTEATIARMAHDVTTFLAWAGEPEMEARKRLGIKVMLFVLVLTAMVYALKRRIWSRLH